jgi:HD-like signal output (HDOD) protein
MKVAEIDRELELAKTKGPLRDIAIQPCPELLIALRAEVLKSDPDPAAIARIAGSDVAMAASLIRVANSPLYARSRSASTVSDAVAMLGVAQTVSILTGFLLRRLTPASTPLIEHFWESSSRRATAMGYIARQLYGIDPDLAHTCGLFCHVGIPVMLQAIKGYDKTLVKAMAQAEGTFTQTENAAHRTDHAVVGAIVAKTWHLPSHIAVAVRLHHDFTVLQDESVPEQARTLVAMSLLAERLVALHEGSEAHTEWVAFGAKCLAYLKINQSEMDNWLDALQPLFGAEVSA